MKTTIKLTILAVMAAFTFSSCSKETIKESGPRATNYYAISNFSKVDLGFSADVKYIYDSEYSVEIEAEEEVLEVMDIKKNGRTLNLNFNEGTILMKYGKIKCTIHSPEFEGGNISGSGYLFVNGPFRTANLNLAISGGGLINIEDIETTNLDATISGGGTIQVQKGAADKVSTTNSSSGNIYLHKLIANRVNTQTTGSGITTVNAINELDVTIAGSGNVHYAGNPRLTKHITGSGKVRRMTD